MQQDGMNAGVARGAHRRCDAALGLAKAPEDASAVDDVVICKSHEQAKCGVRRSAGLHVFSLHSQATEASHRRRAARRPSRLRRKRDADSKKWQRRQQALSEREAMSEPGDRSQRMRAQMNT
ncbi:MAG: hypothetical protein HUU27_11370 [Phycisphaerae bacterium]|nr:hypothetical protein [Phycisphaerae bacterium]